MHVARSTPLSLTANTAWVFAGTAAATASQWGILVVLAKLSGAAAVGQVALGLAIAAPVYMLTNLQLRGVQATDAREEYSFRDYLGLRLVTAVFAFLLILGICRLAGLGGETLRVVILVALAKCFENMADVFHGLFQKLERMDYMAWSQLAKGPTALITVTLLFVATERTSLAISGMAAAFLVGLLVFDFPAARVLEEGGIEGIVPSWNIQRLTRLLKLSFPLGVVMGMSSLNSNIPRYFIEHVEGTALLGVYAGLAYLMLAGNTIISALGQSAAPRLAKYYSARRTSDFTQLFLGLLGCAVALGAGGILVAAWAGKPILEILYTPEFSEHSNILIWLMGVGAISYLSSLLGHALTATRRFRIQMPVFTASTVTTAVLCFWLVPSLGLLGAVMSLLVSSSVRTGGLAFALVSALADKRPVVS